MGWTCKACTFQNSAGYRNCSICGTKRGEVAIIESQPPPPPQPPVAPEPHYGLLKVESQQPIPLLDVKVFAKIVDYSSEVTVSQRFKNTEVYFSILKVDIQWI